MSQACIKKELIFPTPMLHQADLSAAKQKKAGKAFAAQLINFVTGDIESVVFLTDEKGRGTARDFCSTSAIGLKETWESMRKKRIVHPLKIPVLLKAYSGPLPPTCLPDTGTRIQICCLGLDERQIHVEGYRDITRYRAVLRIEIPVTKQKASALDELMHFRYAMLVNHALVSIMRIAQNRQNGVKKCRTPKAIQS